MKNSDFLKTDYYHLESKEILQSATSILLCVGDEIEQALKSLNIDTVFDLATSTIFANARKIAQTAESGQTIFSKFGGFPNDMLKEGTLYDDVFQLQYKSINALQGIDDSSADSIKTLFNVETVRDLAYWPPYSAASQILQNTLLPETTAGFDPEAPSDLIPKSGEYPTEKAFYTQVVIDEVQSDSLIELNEPVDITSEKAMQGLSSIGTGAVVTFEQSWYMQGVTLGNLLHSLALAPGESTRIAMIDWNRQTSGSSSEDVSQAESLSNTSSHNRAINEITTAVATEQQSGESSTKSNSTTVSAGVSVGIGPVGASAGVSHSWGNTTAVSSSSGRRDMAAEMSQNVSDNTQQHASSSRNRHASTIQEVSQKESETITTRVVTNYNHMHALSVQYYEVIQPYLVTTKVNKVNKCLFVPMKVIDNWDESIIRRYRQALANTALNEYARTQIEDYMDSILMEYLWKNLKDNGAVRPHTNDELAWIKELRDGAEYITGKSVATDSPHNWMLDPALTVAGLRPNFLRNFPHVTGFVITLQDDSEIIITKNQIVDGGITKLDEPVPVGNIKSIAVRLPKPSKPVGHFGMTIEFSTGQREFNYENYGSFKKTQYGSRTTMTFTIVNFEKRKAIGWIIDHLQQNKTYYSQQIWSNLDPVTLSTALSQYKYNDKPLLQQVDSIPIGTTGNNLILKMHTHPDTDPEWKTWLDEHGLSNKSSTSEIIPVGSGGVFAEAVLGRFNSAEKLDLTRFWNWQDSPIPITAPEIAPIQAGSRSSSMDLRPGSLDASMISMAAPTTLPDPQGLASILNAISSPDIFRDMSGLSEAISLTESALEASMEAATAAGDTASANLATAAKKQIEEAKLELEKEKLKQAAAKEKIDAAKEELDKKAKPKQAPPPPPTQPPANISETGAYHNELRDSTRADAELSLRQEAASRALGNHHISTETYTEKKTALVDNGDESLEEILDLVYGAWVSGGGVGIGIGIGAGIAFFLGGVSIMIAGLGIMVSGVGFVVGVGVFLAGLIYALVGIAILLITCAAAAIWGIGMVGYPVYRWWTLSDNSSQPVTIERSFTRVLESDSSAQEDVERLIIDTGSTLNSSREATTQILEFASPEGSYFSIPEIAGSVGKFLGDTNSLSDSLLNTFNNIPTEAIDQIVFDRNKTIEMFREFQATDKLPDIAASLLDTFNLSSFEKGLLIKLMKNTKEADIPDISINSLSENIPKLKEIDIKSILPEKLKAALPADFFF